MRKVVCQRQARNRAGTPGEAGGDTTVSRAGAPHLPLQAALGHPALCPAMMAARPHCIKNRAPSPRGSEVWSFSAQSPGVFLLMGLSHILSLFLFLSLSLKNTNITTEEFLQTMPHAS